MTTTYKSDPRAISIIEGKALDMYRLGATRISIKGLIEDTRAEYRLTVNNTDAPAIADQLVADHPELDELIVRRARGRRGPNTVQPTVERTYTLAEVRAIFARAYKLGSKHAHKAATVLAQHEAA